MKIRLAISDDKLDEVKHFFEEKGIEIDDDSEYVLTMREGHVGHLSARNMKTGDKVYISTDDILYIESYGHQMEITTENGTFSGTDPLCQLIVILDPKKFTRISKSVIIAKNKVKQIRPSLSMKFVLTMRDGRRLEVTRSFYNSFRDEFNI